MEPPAFLDQVLALFPSFAPLTRSCVCPVPRQISVAFSREVWYNTSICGGVPVSTGMRKRDQRAVVPGHLNNGQLYKLKNNEPVLLAA